MNDPTPTRLYVVGFYFTDDFTHVALIRKNRPAWQAGLLNGIGGRVEPNETPLDAMVREYAEETGHHTTTNAWTWYLGLDEHAPDSHPHPHTHIDFYWAAGPGPLPVTTTTDEPVLVLPVAALTATNPPAATPNLAWLTRLAIDTATNPRYTITATADYQLTEHPTWP